MDMEGEMEMQLEEEMEKQLEEVREPEVVLLYCYADCDLNSLCIHSGKSILPATFLTFIV